MLGSLVFTQMHKKAFDDWAYSAPPYLAGLEGREGGREETKGVVIIDRIHHPPYQQFLDPPLLTSFVRGNIHISFPLFNIRSLKNCYINRSLFKYV